ncbi:putative ubiquitin carboxyl-terminal hydrolase MINDY-4 [Acropora cervicornis]|uniref:Ubiquitin carboxyl-terminal hydrolase MINDY n=1 Tax=Acropora cervicornis TaxID=6130 RepID=A0AAD9UST1_ACRCE|nr:putative ubiquitin carboxyl-terminal hydrolase MINDY-4 [Acropora cervicornis]
MADAIIVALTASLVREYLSRKGLKSTLQTLDKELPRTEERVGLELCRLMHPELPEPFRTMLEVIVRFMRERDIQNSTSSHVGTERSNQRLNSTRKDNYDELLKRLERPVRSVSSSKTSSKTSNTDLRSSDQRDRQREETNAGILDKPDGRVVAPSHEGSSLLFGDGTARLKNKRRLNTSMGGPVVSSGLVAVRKDARTRHSTGRVNDGFSSKRVGSLLDYDQGPKKEEVDMQSKNQEEVDHNDRGFNNAYKNTQISDEFDEKPAGSFKFSVTKGNENRIIKNNDLVFEDIDDDFDQELAQLSLGPRKIAPADLESKPISLETAMGLKTLIFGNGKASFAPEWRKQGFSFCDLYGLEYGIVQLKGGPCGVLASVQGFVLKHLKLHPSLRERTKALASAISEILWRAGDNKRATVALATGGSNVFGAGRYKPDQLTETVSY